MATRTLPSLRRRAHPHAELLLSVLPPDGDTPLEAVDAVLTAAAAAREVRERRAKPDPTAEVVIADDADLHEPVLELSGRDTLLPLSVSTSLPWLVVHVKDTGRYFSIEVAVLDVEGKLLQLALANHGSTIRAGADTATLPCHTTKGWNRLALHLPTLVRAAFGREYQACSGVTIASGCRLARLFFQASDYADCELPRWLRVMKG